MLGHTPRSFLVNGYKLRKINDFKVVNLTPFCLHRVSTNLGIYIQQNKMMMYLKMVLFRGRFGIKTLKSFSWLTRLLEFSLNIHQTKLGTQMPRLKATKTPQAHVPRGENKGFQA